MPSRSVHGCTPCKRRKIKCNEARPRCSRCCERNLNCSYQVSLKFQDDFDRVGKKFGRQKVKKDLSVASRWHAYVPISNHDKLQFVNVSPDDVLGVVPSPVVSTIIPVDLKLALEYDFVNMGFAIKYYVAFVAPILNPIGDDSVWISDNVVIDRGIDIREMVQYSQSHPQLFLMMAALGCVYLGRNTKSIDPVQSSSWLAAGFAFQRKAVSKAGAELTRVLEGDLTKPYSSDIILVLVLLIMFEIANDCNDQWRHYIKTALMLLLHGKVIPPANKVQKHLTNFAIQYLFFQESVSRTACADENSRFWAMVPFAPCQPWSKTVITWMGCDRHVVYLILEITDLYRQKQRKSVPPGKIVEESTRIGESLRSRVLDTRSLSIKKDSHQCLVLTNESKRLTAELYLATSLDNMVPEEPRIENLVEQILTLLEEIISYPLQWTNTLLWLTFMAGTQISPTLANCDRHRHSVLTILERLERFSLGNVERTRAALMRIWAKRDLDLDEKDGCDWARYVVDETNYLALI